MWLHYLDRGISTAKRVIVVVGEGGIALTTFNKS
jgi:hypothetical protein